MRSFFLVAALALLSVLPVACGQSHDQHAGTDPGVVHVHALAIDPEDPAALYIATHTGLFHLTDEGGLERIGDHFHDLMGFTAVAPGDLVASGHPDLRTPALKAPDKPPLLGLVHSTDGGANWTPLSLLGDADFHSLQAAHGLIYGYSATSGEFMVTADRTTWETRSSAPLVDFAVSPADPNVIVASTERGTLTSMDGGRSWQAAADAPNVVLDWAASGLYAIGADGTVRVSQNAGRTWQERGTIGGPPEALLATDDLLVAATAERGIVESRDQGRTWTVRLPARG